MNTLQEDFMALLLADSGISALLADRISWAVAPQGQAKPLAVLNIISDSDDYMMGGLVDLGSTRVQVDVYALDYLTVWTVVRAIDAKLSGLAFTTLGHTQFQGIFKVDAQDYYDPDATTDKEYRVRIDYMLHQKGV